jgi:hypothetical protein
LEEQLNDKVQENEYLKQDLEKYELEYLAGAGEQGSKTGTRSVSTLKVEVEQLRKDNQRLMHMLKGTREYENFGQFVDDSGGLATRLPGAQPAHEIKEDQEQQQWVPSDAFQMANQFRSEHGNDLSPELITTLLSNLNKIWQDREKKQIQRLKTKSQEEITKLKRQLVARTPFDAIQAKKTIARLNSELSSVKAELNRAHMNKEKQQKAPVGTELIDNTLQIIT